jgi:hypothetical protein
VWEAEGHCALLVDFDTCPNRGVVFVFGNVLPCNVGIDETPPNKVTVIDDRL